MKRGFVAGALAGLLATGVATGLAASTAAGDSDLGKFFFGSRMARAEVVLVLGPSDTHDFRIDQGKVTAVRPGAVDLLEKDGTTLEIAISPTARITVDGGSASFTSIRVGMNAISVRDWEQPAQQLRLTGGNRR